jgi:hypothetical protein
MDLPKRELRQQKREIKRDGSKYRRRLLKQGLAERPEDAPHTEGSFGRYSSAKFNGIDRDSTRKRLPPPKEPATEDDTAP